MKYAVKVQLNDEMAIHLGARRQCYVLNNYLVGIKTTNLCVVQRAVNSQQVIAHLISAW
jgi:hypothetical protein